MPPGAAPGRSAPGRRPAGSWPGLGGADDHSPVDALGDGGGGPLDAVDRVRAEVALLDGVAEGVAEHRPLAPLRRPGRRLPRQGLGARAKREPHRRGVFQLASSAPPKAARRLPHTRPDASCTPVQGPARGRAGCAAEADGAGRRPVASREDRIVYCKDCKRRGFTSTRSSPSSGSRSRREGCGPGSERGGGLAHGGYSRWSESARLGTTKDRRKIGKMRFPPHRKLAISPSSTSNVLVRLEFRPLRT